jgi:hypothetical protein
MPNFCRLFLGLQSLEDPGEARLVGDGSRLLQATCGHRATFFLSTVLRDDDITGGVGYIFTSTKKIFGA